VTDLTYFNNTLSTTGVTDRVLWGQRLSQWQLKQDEEEKKNLREVGYVMMMHQLLRLSSVD
jgi:hypothetical protein